VTLGLAVAEPFDRSAELVRLVRQVGDEGLDLSHRPRVGQQDVDAWTATRLERRYGRNLRSARQFSRSKYDQTLREPSWVEHTTGR
jgi:hypothetical protein